MAQGQSKRSKNIFNEILKNAKLQVAARSKQQQLFEFWHFLLQAEEITLTIGQAFELAYKKFLESKGKDLETQKQSMVMQKRIELLEHENKELKKRLTDVANIKGDNDVKQYMRENNVSHFLGRIFFEVTFFILVRFDKKKFRRTFYLNESFLQKQK